MPDVASDDQLQTKYVFIDTQSFRREGLDWAGKRLSKILELSRARHVIPLITDITKREISAQIREVLQQAEKAISKNAIVLQQLDLAAVATAVKEGAAVQKLEDRFNKYLKDARFAEVPLNAELSTVFDDYFARKPPFSDKKKSEFPDAVVVASLRSWCKKKKTKVYVVSEDDDLRACCAGDDPLIWVQSLADVITKATVSKEFYDALSVAITDNRYLKQRVIESIKEYEVDVSRTPLLSHDLAAEGRVVDVEDVNIASVDVADRDDSAITCDLEIEATVDVELDVKAYDWQTEWHDQHGYWEPYNYSTHKKVHSIFYAEVVLSPFDPKKDEEIEVHSIYLHAGAIELNSNDIPRR